MNETLRPEWAFCSWAITWYKIAILESKWRTGTCWTKKIQIWWLSLTCSSASFALHYGDFVPRDCSAAKGPLGENVQFFINEGFSFERNRCCWRGGETRKFGIKRVDGNQVTSANDEGLTLETSSSQSNRKVTTKGLTLETSSSQSNRKVTLKG